MMNNSLKKQVILSSFVDLELLDMLSFRSLYESRAAKLLIGLLNSCHFARDLKGSRLVPSCLLLQMISWTFPVCHFVQNMTIKHSKDCRERELSLAWETKSV